MKSFAGIKRSNSCITFRSRWTDASYLTCVEIFRSVITCEVNRYYFFGLYFLDLMGPHNRNVILDFNLSVGDVNASQCMYFRVGIDGGLREWRTKPFGDRLNWNSLSDVRKNQKFREFQRIFWRKFDFWWFVRLLMQNNMTKSLKIERNFWLLWFKSFSRTKRIVNLLKSIISFSLWNRK